MGLQKLGVGELLARYEAGEATSIGVLDEVLEAIEADTHNAFVSVAARDALAARAEAIDAARAAGDPVGPLAGVPVALKDNLCQRGAPTTAGSKILEGFVAPYDATVVARLREAGALLIGKTNLDEFSMGSSSERSAAGPVRNPRDPERVAGGSSGGSSAAVAAGLCPAALGSDTGGSIRQPASHCGVVGLKPTYGRVSRWGLIAYASSLDQIGPITRSVSGAARLLQVIAGPDPQDMTCAKEPVPDYLGALECAQDLEGLVVGVPAEYMEGEGAHAQVLEAVEAGIARLEARGAEVREISLPHTRHAVAAYYLIATAEASSNLARYDGVRYGRRAEEADRLDELYERSRAEGFGEEVKRRIMLGTFVLSAGFYDAYYLRAQKARTLIRGDFDAAFDEVDVIASPVAPGPAFALGERVEDPLQMYLEDVYTTSCNLAGLPGVSVPVGQAEGLPVGLQLMAAPFGEPMLLRAARALELESEEEQR